MTWENIKDFLLVATPILIAYMSYRSNKKSRKEVMTELEAKLKEKDADTANEIQKMGVELENQKQLISWNNSQPQTDEYIRNIGTIRYNNVNYLRTLTPLVKELILAQNPNKNDLIDLQAMLNRINLPNRDEELFPYEIPILYDFNLMMKTLESKIKGGEYNANDERQWD